MYQFEALFVGTMRSPLAQILFFKRESDSTFESTTRLRKFANSTSMPVYLASSYSLYTSLKNQSDCGSRLRKREQPRELRILEG